MKDKVVPKARSVTGSEIAFIGLASVSALCYAFLLKLSWKFTTDSVAQDRPTILMLSIFAGLFVLYWIALSLVVRMPVSRLLIGGIVASSCLFRGILLPSIPIHEIDVYRYIWDGAVLADGISPYRYTPDQVRDAVDAGGVDNDPVLQQLVELQAKSGSLGTSLDVIHFGEYPSPYPIVSQAVFALAAKVTPDAAPRHTRLMILKALLVAFDLATLVVVLQLLREVGMHVGWSVAYGWCPLVMKEIANGGHLDSIAIFFTTLAILMLVRSIKAESRRKVNVAIAAAVLALGIGAKLYPVILMPLFAAAWLRRLGWKEAGLGVAVTALSSAVLLYPLLGPGETSVAEATASNTEPQATAPAVEADDGIEAFLKHWEMNDFLFMLVLENIRGQEESEPETTPWFVLTSDEWSRKIVTRYAILKQSWVGEEDGPLDNPLTASQLSRASFSLARLITGGLFALFACGLAWFAAGQREPQAWCRAAMLTLAWFWLTCPTQNPWYWCWVLPLLPFARYRTWHAVAALTMLYYLRFWLMAYYPDPPVLGTPYNGRYFFYFVVAWIEFFPVLLGLLAESIYAHSSERRRVGD